MPTHDYVIANGTGSSVRSDINDALAAIVSQNSSSTAPATTYAYMIWVDTTTNIVKMRNGANSAWIELFETDGEFGSKTFNGNVTLNAQGDLRFADSDSSNWVAFQAPATVASNVTWTLPNADGTSGQTLQTNGSGTLSWVTPSATVDKIEEGNTSAEVVDTGSDGHFKVTTEGSERLRVDSSGNCGIGTASPASDALLTLQGTNRNIFFLSDGAPTDCAIDCSGGRFVFRGGGSGTTVASIPEQMRLDENGRLLLGTTSGSGLNASGFTGLNTYIANTGDTGISLSRFQNTSNAPSLQFLKSRGTSVGSYTIVSNGDDLGELVFGGANGSSFTAGAKIVAQVDGTPGSGSDMPTRLIFGTTADGSGSPTERVRINSVGETSFYAASNSNITARNGAAAGTSDALMSGLYGASGTVSGGTVSLRIWTNGNIQNTNNSYTALSDIKLKENIVDANSQWDDIKALQVRNYNLIEGQTHRQIGLIAQEVEPISPGLVYESPDRDEDGNDLGTTTKSVNYSVLYMKAVKALQEAMERIETLEAANASLEARLAALESA